MQHKERVSFALLCATNTSGNVTRDMNMPPLDLKSKVTAGRRYALEHYTSLAFLVLGLGLWCFVELADEVIEGDTRALDETILLAMRVQGDQGDPVGPAWIEEMFRDFTALGGIGVLTLITAASARHPGTTADIPDLHTGD